VHTIVASDWLEQQEDYNLLSQTLWVGNVNLSPVTVWAVSEPNSQHAFTPEDVNDDSHRTIHLKAMAELFNTAHSSFGAYPHFSLCPPVKTWDRLERNSVQR
jgi:hypothetical protein